MSEMIIESCRRWRECGCTRYCFIMIEMLITVERQSLVVYPELIYESLETQILIENKRETRWWSRKNGHAILCFSLFTCKRTPWSFTDNMLSRKGLYEARRANNSYSSPIVDVDADNKNAIERRRKNLRVCCIVVEFYTFYLNYIARLVHHLSQNLLTKKQSMKKSTKIT